MTFRQISQKFYLVIPSFLVQKTINYPSPFLNHIMATKMRRHTKKTLLVKPTPQISQTNGKHKKKRSSISLKTSSPVHGIAILIYINMKLPSLLAFLSKFSSRSGNNGTKKYCRFVETLFSNHC